MRHTLCVLTILRIDFVMLSSLARGEISRLYDNLSRNRLFGSFPVSLVRLRSTKIAGLLPLSCCHISHGMHFSSRPILRISVDLSVAMIVFFILLKLSPQGSRSYLLTDFVGNFCYDSITGPYIEHTQYATTSSRDRYLRFMR